MCLESVLLWHPALPALPSRFKTFTAKVNPEVAAELLVSGTIDEWTEQTWKQVGEQKGGEWDYGPLMGPGCD